MLRVSVEPDAILFGDRLRISFHRTLRIPEDGTSYPLPPGLGRLPIASVEFPEGQALVLPLYRREALWIGFSGAPWKPNAVKVTVGGVNAVSGRLDDSEDLHEPQDYLVCPDQPWLDGFNAGDGIVRQFVAMPLGEGYAVEAAFGVPESGRLRLIVVKPVPGRFPDTPPPPPSGPMRLRGLGAQTSDMRMALSAGGQMRQKLYPDPYGREAWDPANTGAVTLDIVDSLRFRALTGRDPPASPIDAATYSAHGLPWFELYDEPAGSVAPGDDAKLKTVAERDAELGLPSGDPSVAVNPGLIRTIYPAQPISKKSRCRAPKTDTDD